jgi:hypothetical protein
MAKFTSENLLEIWEPIIQGVEGTIVIIGMSADDKTIFARQLFNDKELGVDVIDYNMDTFDQVFKPRGDRWSFTNNCVYSTAKVPETSKGIGVFKLNNKGDVVSTKVLGEYTGSENYIKMDGEKSGFDGGAIRYTKNGKGRFDLVPGDVIADILSYATDRFYGNAVLTASKSSMIEEAYRGDLDDRFANTVINMVIHHYCAADIVGDVGEEPMMEVSEFCFFKGFYDMLKDLALHYECGAEKYGVDNWKKGIPVTGGERGGSFMDSALRHLNQYCQDLTDEKHYISCIWNCVCGLWTLRNQNK